MVLEDAARDAEHEIGCAFGRVLLLAHPVNESSEVLVHGLGALVEKQPHLFARLNGPAARRLPLGRVARALAGERNLRDDFAHALFLGLELVLLAPRAQFAEAHGPGRGLQPLFELGRGRRALRGYGQSKYQPGHATSVGMSPRDRGPRRTAGPTIYPLVPHAITLITFASLSGGPGGDKAGAVYSTTLRSLSGYHCFNSARNALATSGSLPWMFVCS